MISYKIPIDFDAFNSKEGGGGAEGGLLKYFASRVPKGKPLDLDHYNSPL